MSLLHHVPNIHNQQTLPKVMRQVLFATIPGVAVLCYFFGWGVLIQIAIASTVAIASEAIVMKMRQRDWRAPINDYSALVTAFLLGISIPPLSPWWLIAIGIFFSIVMVKQLYGGLGFNPFNPAMGGYVLLLISFPVLMSSWTPSFEAWGESLSFADTLSIIFTSKTLSGISYNDLLAGFDGYSSATPLDEMKNQLRLEMMPSEILLQKPFMIMSTAWVYANVAFLVGGLYMAWKKVLDWHLPVALLAGLSVMAAIFNLFAPEQYPSVVFHLLHGGTMFAAFFIVTDPVSGSTTPKGRWIFGVSVGILIWIIRTYGGYPDAIAFAILLGNMAVPTIDFYTRPQIYGEGDKS